MSLRRVNLFGAGVEPIPDRPDGYRALFSRLGPQLGAALLSASIYDLPPGESTFPYHYEYGAEEWLLVVAGRPTLRHPGGEDALEPGDVVCFPEGPAGAHGVTNATDETVRVVILSTTGRPAVAVYPDSDKLGFWTGNEADELIVRRESAVDYWDGERQL